jgi:hypothetical protein
MKYHHAKFPKRRWVRGRTGWHSVPARGDDHVRRFAVLQSLAAVRDGG